MRGKGQSCGPKRVGEGVPYSFCAPRIGAKVYHIDSWGIPVLKIVPENGGCQRISVKADLQSAMPSLEGWMGVGLKSHVCLPLVLGYDMRGS